MVEPENLVLELLRAIRSDITVMRNDIAELKLRQNDTHRVVLGLRRDMASDAEATALVHARVDRLQDEIARIKRRLDIVD